MPETTAPTGAAPAFDELVAEIVETPEGRQCTLYPANADDAELVTTWMTAAEDAFVALDDVR